MSEDKAPYGNPSRNLKNGEEPRSENHSELKSVADEMAEALKEFIHLNACEQEGMASGQPTAEMWFNLGKNAQSAFEKFNKLKENE